MLFPKLSSRSHNIQETSPQEQNREAREQRL